MTCKKSVLAVEGRQDPSAVTALLAIESVVPGLIAAVLPKRSKSGMFTQEELDRGKYWACGASFKTLKRINWHIMFECISNLPKGEPKL